LIFSTTQNYALLVSSYHFSTRTQFRAPSLSFTSA